MNTDDINFTLDEHVCLLDELETLLTKQLQLARQGDSTNEQFGILTAKAGSLVGKIAQLGPVGAAEYQYRFERLRQLYKTLALVLAAEKNDVSEKLSRIRKGRKTIGVYRTNT